MVTCSKLRVSAHPRECHLKNTKHSDLRLHANAARATTRGDTPFLPMSVVPNSHPRAEAVPAWRGPLRSAEQQGRSDVLPVRESTGTALRRHVRQHLRKLQHKRKGPASCFVLAANANRGARQTAPNAMLPSLPAGCFESTTRFSVFLRVAGDMASTVFSAMLASTSNGKNFALMLDADSMPMRPKRHHTLIMRRRRWRRNDCDAHLTA